MSCSPFHLLGFFLVEACHTSLAALVQQVQVYNINQPVTLVKCSAEVVLHRYPDIG